jgi:hypothetical protein
VLLRLLLLLSLHFAAPMRTVAAYAADQDAVGDLAVQFAATVQMRLSVPAEAQRDYALRLRDALVNAGLRELAPQYFLLVDRDPIVQAAFVYWLAPLGSWRFVGATPVSTGFAGGYEYFITPLGIYEHTLANPDFRAQGTRNKLGVRGYGVRGMRVYDFGWIEAERTWDKRGRSPMRLQIHATDPDLLENQLGRPRSRGCIRIPAMLNQFLDRRGLLDAEYEQALRQGRHLWVLRADREPVADAGKYLVIIDSVRNARPAWSPWPPQRQRAIAR